MRFFSICIRFACAKFIVDAVFHRTVVGTMRTFFLYGVVYVLLSISLHKITLYIYVNHAMA